MFLNKSFTINIQILKKCKITYLSFKEGILLLNK